MPAVGHTAEILRTLTPDLEDAFLALSQDPNPLHRDDAFGRGHGHAARIAHGLLVTSCCLPAIAAALGTPGFLCVAQSIRFHKPVQLHDALTLRATVAHVTPAVQLAVVNYEARVGDSVVLSGEVHTRLLGSAEG